MRIFYFLLITLLLTTKMAFAVGVKGSVTVKGSMLATAGEAICRNNALNQKFLALARLKADAEKKCPKGYTIAEGPICNTYPGIFVRSSFPSYYCSISCYGNVRCNKSGLYPMFSRHDVNRNHDERSDWLRTHPIDPKWQFIIIEKRSTVLDQRETDAPSCSSPH